MSQMIIRGAIFDLDGTLLDSTGVWREVDIAFFGRHGAELTPAYSRAVRAMGFEECADFTRRYLRLTESAEDILREWHDMVADEYAHRLPLKAGARRCLLALRDAGVRIGLATASRPELFGPALRRTGVYGFFDALTTRAEVSRGKKFPDIYLRTAEKLGVAPESCAVFEDIAEGLRGARSAGMATVAVFDSGAADDWPQIRREADFAVARLDEIPALFRRRAAGE